MPRVRAALLPAPRRALARRRPAAARAVAAARRRRRRAGGAARRRCARAVMSESLDARVAARRQAEMVASLRRLRSRRPAPRQRRQRFRRRRSADRALRPLRQGARPRPPPPAPPRRPPHPLHLRELPRAARRRPGAAPDRARGRCGSTTSTSPTRPGRRSGSRSGSRSSSTRAPAAGSSPSTRARPGRPSRSSRSRPGATCARDNPVLMGLEPDAEALIVNRIAEPPEHAIAPIDECYRLVGMIKLEWDGISGGAGVERAIRAFFAELRERASRSERRDDSRRRASMSTSPFTGAPDPEFEVLRGDAGRAGRGADASASPSAPPTTRVGAVHDRRHRCDLDRALEASLRRRDPRAAVRALRRAASAGPRPPTASAGRRPTRWWAAFEGSTEFELVVPCTYDLELAAAKYFDGLADGEAPLRFHFNGTVFYEAEDGRMQIVQIPWDRSPRFRMPVEAWRESDRRASTRIAPGSRSTARRSSACGGARPSAGCRPSTRP